MNPALLGILISLGLILFAALVGFAVWMIQSRINAKKAAALKASDAEAQAIKELREGLAEDLARGFEKLAARVTQLEVTNVSDAQTLALLKQEMLPMAEAMKRKLVDILVHPSDEFKIPDELLIPIKKVGGQVPEALKSLLTERAHSNNPHVTEYEKLAAEGLDVVTRMAALEAREAPHVEITAVQLVTSTSKTPETKKKEETG